MTYQGELNVSDDDYFELWVERLILRDNQIAFKFYGIDDDEFEIEGTATKRDFKSDACFFMASGLSVKYKGCANKDNEEYRASIKFTSVKEETIQNKNTCAIKGTWLQDGESWDFDGTLDEDVSPKSVTQVTDFEAS